MFETHNNHKPVKVCKSFEGGFIWFISRGYPTPDLLPESQQWRQRKQAGLDLLIIKAAKKAAAELGVTALSARNQFLGIEENTIGVDQTFFFDESEFIKFVEYSQRTLKDFIQEKAECVKLAVNHLIAHYLTVKISKENNVITTDSFFTVEVGDRFKAIVPENDKPTIVTHVLQIYDTNQFELNVPVPEGSVLLKLDKSNNFVTGYHIQDVYSLNSKVDDESPFDKIYEFYQNEINGLSDGEDTDEITQDLGELVSESSSSQNQLIGDGVTSESPLPPLELKNDSTPATLESSP